jgi:predicted tellurium resistance membrane protein TerC
MTETAYLFSAAGMISLFTLIVMEIVLGIDNIIFISILADKLPKNLQKKARRIGLSMALIIRIMLLFSLSWIIGLKETLPLPFGLEFSGKDIILLAGGLFLLAKSTTEKRNAEAIALKVKGVKSVKNDLLIRP